MKQFDDIFRENVKKVFGSYNADHLADEGWNSFAGRNQKRRRRTAVIPLWAKAASVVVLIGLGVFIALRISTRQITKEAISVTESAGKKNEEPVALNETTKTVTPVTVPVEEPAGRENRIEKRAGEKRQIFPGRDTINGLIPLSNERVLLPQIAESRLPEPHYLPVFRPTVAMKELHTEITSRGLISSDLISEDIKPVEINTDKEKPYRDRTLMAGFSGLIAQSSGSISPASGLSVGFYLDQKLTKKISLRPGLALARQTFGLENNGNSNALYGNAISLSDGTPGIPYSYEGQMNLLAMELPLNLVLRVIDRKRSGFYVSAGASTLIYLSQQFTANLVNEYTKVSYNNMSGTYSTETHYSTVEVEKDYGAFSRTDFMGLANLSAGYSFPYSKTGTMLIEPFIQLPVSDLTSFDLKIRYAGVSMKLRFGKQDQEK